MLAVARSFGFPAWFADTGGAQNRCAQTLRAFFPVLAALLGHTTRPGENAETMSPLLMAGKLAVPKRGQPVDKRIRLWVGWQASDSGKMEGDMIKRFQQFHQFFVMIFENK
ncbi:MAG: hypothetical protein E4H32_04330 [Nitrospirales bacterium]|nr:MAG: hypothetical protein E4H32_04330 [Nitrospirales bacterium]